MTHNPHYFIAVPINPMIKQSIAVKQNDLKDSKLMFKQWTHAEDFHITLKFLGPIPAEKLSKLIFWLSRIDTLSAFELIIDGIGTFGNPNRPRVLWIGVQENNTLSKLYKEVELVCKNIGFSTENRPYRPHITLAKRWKGDTLETDYIKQLHKKNNEIHRIIVDQFVLYRIHPSTAPKYEVIERFQLNNHK